MNATNADPTPARSAQGLEQNSGAPNSATWRRRVVAVALLASIGCAVDLASKRWVFEWLGTPPEHRIYWIWKGYFGLETSINTGALFGMGSGHTSVLAGISILATVGIVVWVATGAAVADWISTVAVGLILGGVWGNLYDRLGLWGMHGVRDWILWQYGEFVWPNFNIADSLLVCGSVLLILHAFRASPLRSSSPSPQ